MWRAFRNFVKEDNLNSTAALHTMKISLKIFLTIWFAVSAMSAAAQSVLPLPLQSQLPPLMHNDLASINAWKPEIKTITPILAVEEEEAPEYISDMLAFARSFSGTRYRRGGKTPKGFDCSGFTGYVFRQFGINLNADSRSQYLQGEAVNDDSMQPGDLVFFSGRARSKSHVGHVGIVTSVDAENGTFKFIHSSTSSGVIESRSTEPYYHNRYIGARRVE